MPALHSETSDPYGCNYLFYLNLHMPDKAYSTGDLFLNTIAFNEGSAVSPVTSELATIGFDIKSLNP